MKQNLKTEALAYFAKMQGAYQAMPEAEREALREWERAHVSGDSTAGTSDWPGWEKYIGLLARPEMPCPAPKKKRLGLTAALRESVFATDGFRCRHCGNGSDLTIDHIYPVSKGGSNALFNLQTLCRSCNSQKGVRT